jgi:hypothetical protein
VTELGCLGQQSHRLRAIGGAAASGHLEHRQREHRLAIAARGGELVPLRGLLIVVRNAEAVGVKLAQQGHRLGIVFLLDPPHRLLEGADITTRAGIQRRQYPVRWRRWQVGLQPGVASNAPIIVARMRCVAFITPAPVSAGVMPRQGL